MSKVGRNDPCPCGSGKKYKNCHMPENEEKKRMQKDEEEKLRSEKANAYSSSYDKSSNPDDENYVDKDPSEVEDYEDDDFDDEDYEDLDFFDELESEEAVEDELITEEDIAADEFWDKFTDAAFSEKGSLMEEAFNNPVFAYPEYIFDLFFEMSSTAKTSTDREMFIKMVRRYKEKLPKKYKEDADNILDYCIDFVIIDKKPDELKSFFLEYAKYAADKIYQFITCAHEIAYHGYLELLTEGFRIGWKKVKNSDDIFPWVIEDFSFQGSKYELFNYLQNVPHANTGIDFTNLSDNERILLEKLKYFDDELDGIFLSEFIAGLERSDAPNWDRKLLEQNYKKLKGNERLDYLINLLNLFNEFVDYLHNERWISYPKADLMRSGINLYLQNRLDGEFKIHFPKNSKLYNNFISKALLPDISTLEVFIFDLEGILGSDLYKFFAFYECIPYWLDFLQLNDLIDQTAKDKVFNSIAELNSVVQKIIKGKAPYDEFLKAEMKAAWKSK